MGRLKLMLQYFAQVHSDAVVSNKSTSDDALEDWLNGGSNSPNPVGNEHPTVPDGEGINAFSTAVTSEESENNDLLNKQGQLINTAFDAGKSVVSNFIQFANAVINNQVSH